MVSIDKLLIYTIYRPRHQTEWCEYDDAQMSVQYCVLDSQTNGINMFSISLYYAHWQQFQMCYASINKDLLFIFHCT